MDKCDVHYLLENLDRLSAHIQRAGTRGLVRFFCPPTGETDWERFRHHPFPALARLRDGHINTLACRPHPRRFPPFIMAP